ncbi:hypothetical protein FKM82_025426 [Ascaphus truei]|uniref:WAP four-disulfide core domain protein 2-like n=1 Tax=Ascaphus truei TaxID=8439 RepID=UPI003F5A3D05
MSGICIACILILDQNGALITPVSNEQEKPGSCPLLLLFALGKCDVECRSDGECAGKLKCCETGCSGTYCQMPNDKPGSCPWVNREQPCDRRTLCRTDSYCDADLKCCRTRCGGFSCLVPGG